MLIVISFYAHHLRYKKIICGVSSEKAEERLIILPSHSPKKHIYVGVCPKKFAFECVAA